jgi:membrane protein implicated in regulation of membrane protease activity
MKSLILLLLYILISALLMIGSATEPALILLAVSSAFGGWLIWRFVRRINARDTPRFQSRAPTPDGPSESN